MIRAKHLSREIVRRTNCVSYLSWGPAGNLTGQNVQAGSDRREPE